MVLFGTGRVAWLSKFGVVDFALTPISCGQGGDLSQVVGEDPLPSPGFRPFEVVQAGAIPPVSAFEGADPSFASGSPFEGSAECSTPLDPLACGTGSALAGDDDSADTKVGQLGVDGGLAVAAVCSHRPRRSAVASFDPSHCGRQLRCVGRVPDLYVVIQHATVVVVDDLGLVAELDRLTEPAFRDRPSVLIVQTHHPVRPVRGDPGDPLSSLSDDPRGRLQQVR